MDRDWLRDDRPSFMETKMPPRSVQELVVAGSSVPFVVNASTLDYTTGRSYQKVIPGTDDHDLDMFRFFESRKAGYTKDKPTAQLMTEKVMPLIQRETAHCALAYTEKLGVLSGCFDDHAHFQPLQLRGKGTSGEVWAYSDTKTKNAFVRKRLKEGKSLRLQEVRTMLVLDHPNVCKIFGLLCDGPTVDLLLQDAGYPLHKCLQKFLDSNISAERYWKVVKDLAQQGFEALVYMHEQGICHLDIKPENMLMHLHTTNNNPVLVLADFGTSLPVSSMVTFRMQLTPEYWCPEMWGKVLEYLESLPPGQALSYSDAFQFPCEAGFDTFAMGLVVHSMGTLQHLIYELDKNRHSANSTVLPAEVEQFCQLIGSGKLNPGTAFKMLLMTKYGHLIPSLASEGCPWKKDNIPVTLTRLIEATLNPDPKQRWTDKKAAEFLAKSEREDTALKTPTPVADASFGKVGQCPSDLTSHLDPPAGTTQCFNINSSAPVSSDSLRNFNQRMAPLMKYWDNHTTNTSVAGTAADVHDGKLVAIPLPTSSKAAIPEDIALRSMRQQQRVLTAPGTTPALGADDGVDLPLGHTQTLQLEKGHVLNLNNKGSWDEEVIDLTDEGGVDIERATGKASSQNDVLDPPIVVDDVEGFEQDHKGLKGQFVLGGGIGELSLAKSRTVNGAGMIPSGTDTAVGFVANGMAALNVTAPGKRFRKPAASKAPAAKSLGKGSGKRNPNRASKHGGIPFKGAEAVSLKSSPAKHGMFVRGVRGKKQLAAGSVPVTKVPFWVASSSRPTVTTRTLDDMAAISANARASTKGSTADEGILGSVVEGTHGIGNGSDSSSMRSLNASAVCSWDVTGDQALNLHQPGFKSGSFSAYPVQGGIFGITIGGEEVELLTEECFDLDQPDRGGVSGSESTLLQSDGLMDVDDGPLGLDGVNLEDLLQLLNPECARQSCVPVIGEGGGFALDRPPPQVSVDEGVMVSAEKETTWMGYYSQGSGCNAMDGQFIGNAAVEDPWVAGGTLQGSSGSHDAQVGMPNFSVLLDSDSSE